MKFRHFALLLILSAGCSKQQETDSSSRNSSSKEKRTPAGVAPSVPARELDKSDASPTFPQKLARLVQTSFEQERAGDYEKAILTRRQVLALVENQFGHDSWQATNARLSIENTEHKSRLTPQQREKLTEIAQLDEQAKKLAADGQMAEAGKLFSQILEVSADIWPQHSHPVANYAFRKAQVSVANKQYAEAEQLLKFAIPVLERVLGRTHPEYASAINSLGMLYQGFGRFDEARSLLIEAAEVTETVWGEESSQTATQLNNLGTLWHTMERYADAEHMLQKALSLGQKIDGPNHVSVAHTHYNLGALYISTRDFQRAVAHLRPAAEIYQRAAGLESWTTIRTLSSLATAHYALHEYAEAETLLRQVVSFAESKMGPTNEVTIDSNFRLAMAACFQAKYEEAEPLLLRTLELQQQKFGNDSPQLAPTLRAYAELLDRTGRKSGSENVMSRAAALQTRTAERPPESR